MRPMGSRSFSRPCTSLLGCPDPRMRGWFRLDAVCSRSQCCTERCCVELPSDCQRRVDLRRTYARKDGGLCDETQQQQHRPSVEWRSARRLSESCMHRRRSAPRDIHKHRNQLQRLNEKFHETSDDVQSPPPPPYYRNRFQFMSEY